MPCPNCGNEERHNRTGLLTCECPADSLSPAPAPLKELKAEDLRDILWAVSVAFKNVPLTRDRLSELVSALSPKPPTEARLIIEEMLQRIESGHKGSIGSIENTYVPQIGVEEIKRWRDRLAPTRSPESQEHT